jgi:hypothetical protein
VKEVVSAADLTALKYAFTVLKMKKPPEDCGSQPLKIR